MSWLENVTYTMAGLVSIGLLLQGLLALIEGYLDK